MTSSEEPRRPRVTYLVRRLQLGILGRLDDVTAGYGLTTPQFAALTTLRTQAGISSAALARWASVSAQAMNEMVGALERKSLIERRPGPNGGRALGIFLTEQGRTALAACEAAVEALEAEMMAPLTTQEQTALRTSLEECLAALKVEY